MREPDFRYDNLQPGRVLRDAFREKGLRVTEVAEELGVHYVTLSAILHDRKDAGLEIALKLSEKCGLPDDLVPILTLKRKIARLTKNRLEPKF